MIGLFSRANYNAPNTDADRQFAIRQLLDLAKNGADFLRNQNPSEATTDNWIGYSEKIVELATKRYDANIHLSYLQMLLSIRYSKDFGPYQRVKTCLDYLLGVIEALNNKKADGY